MRLTIIAVGTKMPAWVETGYNEYAKRMPSDMAVKMVEIAPGHRGKNADIKRAMAKEGEQMLGAIPKGDKVIALEVTGKPWSTEQLAAKLGDWRQGGDNISLLIGGPDGLHPDCLAKADAKWSLSNLTLPHPLVRVVLSEQLYRAWSILQGHPYHRA